MFLRRAVGIVASFVVLSIVASGQPVGAAQLAGVPDVIALGSITPTSVQPNDIVRASPSIAGVYSFVMVLLVDEYGGTHALSGFAGTNPAALVPDWWPSGTYRLGAIQVTAGTLFNANAGCFYCYVYYDFDGDQVLEGAYDEGFTNWRSAVSSGLPFTQEEIDAVGVEVVNSNEDVAIADLESAAITGGGDGAFPAGAAPRFTVSWGVDTSHPYDSGYVSVVGVRHGVPNWNDVHTWFVPVNPGARTATVDLAGLPNGRYRVSSVTLLTDDRYQLLATIDGSSTYPPNIGGGAVLADLSALRFSVGVPPDVTPPTLTLPGSVTAEAMSAAGATVTFAVSADDAVDGPVTPTCAPVSGSTMAIGTTTVTCGATDEAGNTASGSFDVHVSDTTGPVLAVPTSVTAEATSANGAAAAFETSASDLVDGPVTPSCAPVSGSTFALGSTPVSCTATDAHGNATSSSFELSVVDTTAPAFDAQPARAANEAVGPVGAPVVYDMSATDLVDGVVTPSCAPASGSVFAIGRTNVTCIATDAAGNTSTTVFDVVVVDTTAPVLELPGGVTQEATGPGGARVTFGSSAQDIVDGAVAPTCSPASGSTFPLGSTVVTCTAVDGHGNGATATFGVLVRDTTAPVLTLTGNAGSYDVDQTVSISCTATDAVSTPTCTPTLVTAPSASFGAGPHSLTFAATDAAGNRGTAVATFEVTPTVDGMINLTNRLVSKPQLASSLTAKLRSGNLEAYRKELRAQTGKGVTAEDAELLTDLSYALAGKRPR